MAYSYIQYTGNGSQRDFTFAFPYFNTSDISVKVNGVAVPFTFTSANTVNVTTAPVSGSVVLIRRTTPKSVSPVDFTDGSVLLSSDLDTLSNFSLYAAQESIDTANLAIIVNDTNNWEGQNKTIQNVANPVNPQDVATKVWAETGMTAQLSIATNQASAAGGSATAAASSAAASSASATSSSTSASTATTKAAEAVTSATAAATSATNSATSASTSSTKAAEAVVSATTATASASTATTSATNAATSATNAANSATSAGTSATNAATSATNAAASAASINVNAFVGKDSASGAAFMPSGTTAERPVSPATGYQRFNTTLGKPEVYNGSTWGSMGGGATGGGADAVFQENSTTVTTSYTLSTGKNAMVVGALTLNSGVTVTVPTGQRLVVL